MESDATGSHPLPTSPYQHPSNIIAIPHKSHTGIFDLYWFSLSRYPALFNMEHRKDQAGGKRKQIIVGPWGGNGGTSWDDGIYHGVREITLVYDLCIDSIRVVYDKNGTPVSTEKHGGVGGSRIAEIKLQHPEEFLTSVSGHYCPVVHGGGPVIRSLKFKSNRRTFGPFGVEEGTPFSFSTDGALIVGFKGRSGWYLDAIGFHLSSFQNTKLLQKVQRKLKKLLSTAPRTTRDDE